MTLLSKPFVRRMIAALVMCMAPVPGLQADRLDLYFTWNIQGDIRFAAADSVSDSRTASWINTWSALASIGADSASVLIDLGNTLYPGFLSRFSYGSVVNELLNLAGYSAKRVTAGDFLLGMTRLLDLQRTARYSFLASGIGAGDSARPLFETRRTIVAGEARIVVYTASRSKPSRSLAAIPDSVRFAPPSRALDKIISGADTSVTHAITVCLTDQHTLDSHGDLLNNRDIDLFVCGLPAYAPGQQPVVREKRLASGARVLFVPGIDAGIGRLRLTRDGEQGFAAADFSVIPAHALRGEARHARRIRRLVDTWASLYASRTSGVVAVMHDTLDSAHHDIVANLLRERFGVELALIERSLVNAISIPDTITMHDLDRLLTSAPELYIVRLRGKDIRALARLGDIYAAGINKGAIQGRAIRSDETYSAAITENILARMRGRLRPAAAPALTYESAFDAVQGQLAERKRTNYDFAHLDKRWRFTGETNLRGSRRSVAATYPDSTRTLSGFSDKNYSAWDVTAALTFNAYNRLHHIEFRPRLEYAAANENTGRNTMEYRCTYSLGTSPLIRPYASASYQSYIIADSSSPGPVAIRSAAGAQWSPGSWRLKLGVGAEKRIRSSDPNPFAPFGRVFSDTAATWGPGAELLAEGDLSISKLLRGLSQSYFAHHSYRLHFLWETYIGYLGKEKTFQTTTRIEPALHAGILPHLELRLGLRVLHAHYFNGPAHFYNVEPSLSFSGVYRLKW